ncbi:ParB/RepB/Spo0J family partition protein [Planctomycetota bacterium]
MKRAKLGKGLSTLIDTVELPRGDNLRELPMSALQTNPEQPRKSFDNNRLHGLAESIREHGLVQPIVVMEFSPGQYKIIAGERRFRAYQILNHSTIPAIIRRKAEDREMLELALTENLQRENLNPIEKAEAYRNLIDNFDLTQDQLATRLGKSRAGIANSLRLLTLPPSVQALLEEGKLSEGHAKVLLACDDVTWLTQLARQVIKESWSVRTLEEKLASATSAPAAGKQTSNRQLDAHIFKLQQQLCEIMGTRVKIKLSYKNKCRGKIILSFSHNDDFENLIEKLCGNRPSEEF